MSVLICICSKYPNPKLYTCVKSLYDIQIKNDLNNLKYKICIVDSDSDNYSNYEEVKNIYPDIELHYIKNKNYEYGAWKYIQEIYSDYDYYFCIQDTIIIQKYIDLKIINNNNVYTHYHVSGFNSHMEIKYKGIKILQNSNINYHTLIDTDFNLAQHNIFIVNNFIMKDIFKILTIHPVDKEESCCYERIFGIYFIIKNIITHDIQSYVSAV